MLLLQYLVFDSELTAVHYKTSLAFYSKLEIVLQGNFNNWSKLVYPNNHLKNLAESILVNRKDVLLKKQKTMYQLIYSSIIRKNCTDAAIANLLLKSQSQNVQNGITGCIVYHNNEFLHLIEGEKKSVTELFKRIAMDTRHGHVSFLFDSEVNKRAFNYSYISGAALASIEALQETLMLSCSQLGEFKNNTAAQSTAVKFYWKQVQELCDTVAETSNLNSSSWEPALCV